MEKLLFNIIKWLSYSVGFLILTEPLTEHFQLGFLIKVSISIILGFFAGILNEISGTLQSINNQLRGRH